MALMFRILYRTNRCINYKVLPMKWCTNGSNPVRILGSGICSYNKFAAPVYINESKHILLSIRSCSTQNNAGAKPPPETKSKKGIIQKFKEMYRDYWYVVLPVHITTSAIWFGSFYYAVSSGVDVIGLLENFNVSENLLSPLRDSSAGYFAIAFALYKLATPLRYAVTVGGTTYAIKKLQTLGWIRPVPSRERIKEMIQERKENLQGRIHESKQHYQIQIKEKGTHVMEEMKRYKTEIRNIKSKVKKM
ncbi:uncharacterized protein C18orf19 homolog A [Battus philenor]|uniref:uncharacterized protein C18orf19 homolog A n=1 Tax=Battus philenor TaxID=42288 RepID=UPI0035D0F96B